MTYSSIAARFTRVMFTLLTVSGSIAGISNAQTVPPVPEFRGSPSVRIRATATTAPVVGDVNAAVQLTAGSIIVADNANKQLHFYTARGQFVRTVGREGSGPGEFQAIRWVGECGRDTIYAFDYMQNRISTFKIDGTMIRSFTAPAASTAFIRCALDGTMSQIVAPAPSGLASRGALQTTDPTGKLLFRSPPLLLDQGYPLGAAMKVAMMPDVVVYGAGDSAFVNVMSVRGERNTRIPVGVANRVPTDTNRSATLEFWVKSVRGTQADYARLRALFAKLPKAKTLTAYNDLFVDPATRILWVKISNFGDPTTVFERRGLDGVLTGRLILPPNLETQQIRNDVLLAIQPDPVTGEKSVVTFRIHR